MFWKKEKNKIIFNNRKQKLIDILPPTIGMKNTPAWWTNKNNYKPHITSCSGIIELYKRSITIPLWVDFEIELNNKNISNIFVPGVHPDNMYEYVVAHHSEQYNNAYDDYHHIKLINPWLIETAEMVPFLLIDAVWNRNTFEDYTIPSGMLEFKYQHSCHINIFVKKSKEYKKIKFEGGSKFVQLIPLYEKELEIEYKKIDQEKFLDLMPLVITEHHNYYKIKNISEKNNEK